MAIINFRHFIKPGIMMAIAPDRLVSLLYQHKEYFHRRGFFFPGERSGPINYAKLSSILVDPDDQVPSSLVDALYFISEMATTKIADKLVVVARSVYPGMAFSPLATAADIIVEVWLKDPDLVAKVHAASLINKPKSFEYHLSRNPRRRSFSMPTSETIQAMEAEMDEWFDQNRRGRDCRIIVSDHGDRISFLIRHGKQMRRDSRIKNGKSVGICYRPEVYDVVFYDRIRDELGIRASGTKGEKTLYRETIGDHIFNNWDYFDGNHKFTLEPLAKDGIASLVCSDVDGLDQVTLKAYGHRLNDEHSATDWHASENLFHTMAELKRTMPPASDLTKAVFLMKLTNVQKPRSLTIKLPNRVMYLRDDESHVIDKWLSKRGFTADPLEGESYAINT
jgi:hypothetical protein